MIDEGQGPFTEPRAKDEWFKEVGNSRAGRGSLSLDSLLPRGSSQDMFPKPSLCTTANSRCQPLYLPAKTGHFTSVRRLFTFFEVNECNGDFSPIETIAHQLAVGIASG